MDGWKHCFFLLLPLCADTKVTVVETTGREPVITPVCMNENFGVLVVVTCGISTGRHQGAECHLLYTHDKKFNPECDTRFILMTENRTIFLRLTSLTPVDSGNYSCECSYERGTHAFHLAITVKEEEGGTFTGMRFIATAVITVTVTTIFVMAAVIICGTILRRNSHRQNTSSGASELTRTETPYVLEEDHYTSLQQPASDIYQTISNQLSDPTSVSVIISRFNYQETHNEEDFHPSYSDYETI